MYLLHQHRILGCPFIHLSLQLIPCLTQKLVFILSFVQLSLVLELSVSGAVQLCVESFDGALGLFKVNVELVKVMLRGLHLSPHFGVAFFL